MEGTTFLPQTWLNILAAIFLPIALMATTISLWIWRQYKEIIIGSEIEELRRDKKDEFEKEISQFIASIFGDIRVDGSVEFSKVRKIVERQEITEDDIVSIVEAWEAKEKPRILHQARKREYKKSYRGFAIVALLSVSIPVVSFLSLAAGIQPYTWAWDIGHSIIGITAAAMLFRSINSFKRANKLDENIKDL